MRCEKTYTIRLFRHCPVRKIDGIFDKTTFFGKEFNENA